MRQLAISMAGRLSDQNPAYVLPALRCHLVQLLPWTKVIFTSVWGRISSRRIEIHHEGYKYMYSYVDAARIVKIEKRVLNFLVTLSDLVNV